MADFKAALQPRFVEKINISTQKIAVLVGNEFEGLTHNGGIGTYYANLSQKLAADGWTVILLLCQANLEQQEKCQFDHIVQVVSVGQIPELLILQPLHQHILNAAQRDHVSRSFSYHSICCLFFIQALEAAFSEAIIYAEFPEIWGFGYHTIQAKQAGYLSHNCLTGVTSHGSFEWLREINSQYQSIDERWFWQAYHCEQFSYENADVTYSPSQFLKEKVASYGWKTDHVKHLPYFLPTLQLPLEGSPAKPIEIKPDHIPVVFFGRLEERKGLCSFLEAVKLLEPTVADQIHLIFMGKAVPLHSPCLVPLNSHHYIERELSDEFAYTLCTDFSSQEAVAAIASLNHSIVCLTSLQENFPNAALEMGQLPIHLVVSDTDGFHETLDLVQRTDAVHWFHPGNAHSLAQVLTQAVKSVSKQPSILPPETHHQTNQHLLNQRLEYMSQAFLAAAPKEPLTPDVTLILICRQSGDSVLGCLTSLAAQTYEHLNITVVASAGADELTAAAIAQAQTEFPDYKYLTVEDGWSLGITYNHLIQQATGEYILFFPANQMATPSMLEWLVTAANESDAVAVVCPQLVLSNNDQPEHITLVDGNLLKLLEFNHHYDLTALFARSFLNAFPFNEEQGLLGLNWQLFAAAIATDQPIAYYPYPLYTIRADAGVMIPSANWPQERYYLRQFLGQIPSDQWHRRQINLLLTGFEQIAQRVTPQQSLPIPSSPQDQAWQITAQQLQAELVQAQARLQPLEPWNQELQAGKAWLESQWQTWMLKAQKAEAEGSQLRSLIHEMQTSKFWRLRRGWLKLKRLLGQFQSDPLLPPAYTYTPGIQAFIARMAGQKVRFFQPEATSPPVVTVISSCVQGYEYLETTYRSITNQTLQSFEWLLVKDSSTTPEYNALLTSLSQRTPKIRLLAQESSSNVAAHFNQAISQAQGQYLCFVDIGAVLDPTYLEKCVLFLESHPPVAVVNSYSVVFQSQEHWWQTELNYPHSLIDESGFFCHPVYRKVAVDEAGGFDESLSCCADWDYCLKIMAQSSTHHLGWTIPEYLDGYRATPHTAPALSPSPTAEFQHTLSAIRSRYHNKLSNQPIVSLTPPPLTLDTLNNQFQIANQRPIIKPSKRVMLLCDALDTSEIAKWNCDLVSWLTECGYEVAIITTSTSDHACQEYFYPATADIFHLPNLFNQAYWLAFTHYLLKARQTEAIFVSGSTIAESFLPIIRAEFPQVALLIYTHLNNQKLDQHGHHSRMLAHGPYLDYCLAASYRQARSYTASHPDSPTKTKVCRSQPDVEAALAEAIQKRQGFAQPTTKPDREQAVWELLKDLQASMTAEPTTASQPTAVPTELSTEPTIRQLTKLLLRKIIKM
jgi:glycosyltransferase involved in cell wall biosynthesis